MLCMLKSDNSGFSLSHSKTRNVTFAIRERERELTSFERAYIPNVTKMLNRKISQRDVYTSQHWSEGIKQGLI
jgi:hypothetical protein